MDSKVTGPSAIVPEGLLETGPDGPDTSRFEILDLFTVRFAMLARLMDRESKQLLDINFGLSLAEWRILAILAISGPMTVSDLAEQGGFDKSQISRAVASMEEAGRVTRSDSPTDGRSAIISLAEEGSALYGKMIPVIRERNRRLLALMTPDQRATLYEAMDILTNHLREKMD